MSGRLWLQVSDELNLDAGWCEEGYDEASSLLMKLRDLAIYQHRLPEFQARLAGLRAQYPKRPSLQDRLRRVAEVIECARWT